MTQRNGRAGQLALVTRLSDVIALVAANPGATSNAIVRELAARRGVVLSLLRLGRAAGLLRCELGPRRSKVWFALREPDNWYPDRQSGGDTDA
ncbi:MAG: hypothetical protein ACYDA3_13500 [Gaiellaceae bacterium]